MVLLALWVAISCVRIELLNAQADFYLPRKDGGADGAWRVSPNNEPRDQLRGLIEVTGLLQYPLAMLLAGLAVWQLSKRGIKTDKRVVVCCLVVSLVALAMAVYRGYYTSLGD
jgi:hypothetical protein